MTALERVLDALREAGRPVTRSGDGWRSSCPAHDGQNRTALSINQGRDGVLVYCHADITCTPEAIAKSLGLTVRDLFDRPGAEDGRTGGARGLGEPTAVYDYVDEHGELLYQVCRFVPKDFRQRRPDGRGGWTYRTKGVRRVLYRLPEVLAAVRDGRTVYLVEGEKDADAIAAAGATATSITNGAKGQWSEEYTAALTGAHVVIVADNDAPGLAHARRVQGYLDGRAASVRVVRAAVDQEKADASDHFAAGHGLDDFVPLDENDLADPDGQDATDQDAPQLPPPANPMAVARELLDYWHDRGRLILRHWRGTWMVWRGSHWAELEHAEVRSVTYRRTEHATYQHQNAKGEIEERAWAPSKRKIADVLDAQAAIVHLSGTIDPPAWIGRTQRGRAPMISCANGLLNISDGTLIEHDPAFFNLVAVPFDYVPGAECPRWLEFLAELWPDDPDQVAALQEWFGYVISGRTDLHKVLLIVGPTRSGKGTIARILTRLIGKPNVAGPTLASLATNFGLQPLLGKPLAIISDARLGGRDTHQVTERLLTVSGEDTIDVDRKYQDPWTGKLPTRFMILSNELPHFGDASGVIANRFLVLTMTASWLGRENTSLIDELSAELPGILNWALEGLANLQKRGRFTEPGTSVDARTTMQDMASPTSAFVRERCQTGPGLWVPRDELWADWKTWAEDNGHKPGTKAMLGRNLRSVVPQLQTTRPHGQARRYVGIALRTAGNAHNGESSGSPGSRRSEPREGGSSPGSAGNATTTGPGTEPGSEPPGRPSDLHEPGEPRQEPIVELTCAVPDCPKPPRRACRTCADHMDREQDFGSAA